MLDAACGLGVMELVAPVPRRMASGRSMFDAGVVCCRILPWLLYIPDLVMAFLASVFFVVFERAGDQSRPTFSRRRALVSLIITSCFIHVNKSAHQRFVFPYFSKRQLLTGKCGALTDRLGFASSICGIGELA